MAQPYVGEIRIFAGNFEPNGWRFCNGQHLQIATHDTLFQLIGTAYGGDGQDTFALPDLRGRLPMHQGNGFILAETGGVESVTLTQQQIPIHTHPLIAAATPGNEIDPANALLANSANVTPYINQDPDGNMNVAAIAPVGGSQPHENFQPYLCLNYIISLFGIFPTQT